MSRPSATTQPWWERSHVCVWVFTCANACVRVCAIERSGSQIQWLINTVLWCTITIMLLASFSYISGAPLTFRMHFLTEVWALFEDASASLPSLLSLASTSVQNYASSDHSCITAWNYVSERSTIWWPPLLYFFRCRLCVKNVALVVFLWT